MDSHNAPGSLSPDDGPREHQGSIGTIRVGIADAPFYSEPLRSSPESFFQLYTRQLIAALDPTATALFEHGPEPDWAAELAGANPRIELAIGLHDTGERQAGGLGFLNIPGMRHGIAWRLGRAGWVKLLDDVQRRIFFGPWARRTAHLYADLLVVSYLDPRDVRPDDPIGGRAGWSPIFGFDFGGESFRDQLCQRFCAVSLSGLTARLAASSQVGSPEENDRRVLAAVRRDGRRLIPDAWEINFQEALRAITEGSGHVSSPSTGARAEVDRLIHCLSCSAYLADGIHGGSSDHYCKDCSDESGNLRPRSEVAECLARWISEWQSGLTVETSREKAERYMAAMPAWNGA